MTTLPAIAFVLPLPPRALSSNGSHGHWASHARAAREYRLACYWAILASGVRDGWTAPERAELSLRFVLCRMAGTGLYAPLDQLNAAHSFKNGADSLKDAGLIVDDSAKHLAIAAIEIERHTGHKAGQCEPGIYVTLRTICPTL